MSEIPFSHFAPSISGLSRFKSKPAAARTVHHGHESQCTVHSSALIDDARSLQQGSGKAIAAHVFVGMTEPTSQALRRAPCCT
jgi:hypothetical protein